ncbi:prostaglandin reductase 1-like isoform X2 [Thrips palmi]|nr:prostaglandin reductase 1-like isoform X2 [Thrips palmi]
MVFMPSGAKMLGLQVAKVVQSKDENYKVGEYVSGPLGWATHSVLNPSTFKDTMHDAKLERVRYTDVPLSYSLTALGLIGATAYFGLLDVCKPKEGETLVVNAAAGGVGTIVGQIAKLKGLRVIGFAGSNDKVKWLTEELQFDFAYNYKTCNVVDALKESAPNGVDCYFDNVGGAFSSLVLTQMNTFGRIAVVGAISSYDSDLMNQPLVPAVQTSFIAKQLKMEGLIVSRYESRFPEAYEQIYGWIKEGKLKCYEHVYEGFENLPKALLDVQKGGNTGKAVLKVK